MIIEVDGQRYEVPDDATPAEIDALTAPTPKMGPWKAAGLGAAQGGTAYLADEAQAGAETAADAARGLNQKPLMTPGPRQLAKLYPGVPYPQAAAKWFDANRPDLVAVDEADRARVAQSARFQTAAERARVPYQQAQKDQPEAYLGGNIGGAVVTLPAKLSLGGAAALGGVQGFGASEAGANDGIGLLRDTAIGLGAGVAGQTVGKALGAAGQRVSKYASDKIAKLRGAGAPKATEEALSELASATGKFGGLRQTENKAILALLAQEKEGVLTAANQQALDALKASGRVTQAINEAAANNLEFLGTRIPEVAAAKTEMQTLQQGLPQTIANKMDEAVSLPTAKRQVMDRVRRYWIPATGGLIGLVSGDDATGKAFGAGAGLLAGRGASPTIQALIRMMKNPAVQTQMVKQFGGAAQAATGDTSQTLMKALAAAMAAQTIQGD